MRTKNNTIVKFRIGRGRRFNNPGYLSFVGVEKINEGDAYNSLFLNEKTGKFFDSSGNSVELTLKEAETGIGRINIDNEYNTIYTKLLNDCTSDELFAIAEEGLNSYLFDYLGIENAEELFKLGYLLDALESSIFELENYINEDD